MYVGEDSCNSYFVNPASKESVMEIIDSLNNKMTCGPDEIPVAVVKRVKQEIAGPISLIINKSVEHGKCPQKLKETKVIPIQKDKNSFK